MTLTDTTVTRTDPPASQLRDLDFMLRLTHAAKDQRDPVTFIEDALLDLRLAVTDG